jgi:hypothetical protein
MRPSCFAFLLISLTATSAAEEIAHEAARLNPPWVTLHQQIKHSLGADGRIRVGDLVEVLPGYQVDLHANSDRLAEALAMVVRPQHEFGRVIVEIRIFDPSGRQVAGRLPNSGEDLLWACHTSLRCSPYYCRSFTVKRSDDSYVVALLRPAVIQYYNDDLSDYYGNANEVAQAVFKTLLHDVWDEPGFRGRLLLTTQKLAP